jgi:hypothetical protein
MSIEEQQAVMTSSFGKGFQDKDNLFSFNGTLTNRAYYNLIVDIGAMRLYINSGMIPARGWKQKTVKERYAITGSAENALTKLEFIKNEMIGK